MTSLGNRIVLCCNAQPAIRFDSIRLHCIALLRARRVCDANCATREQKKKILKTCPVLQSDQQDLGTSRSKSRPWMIHKPCDERETRTQERKRWRSSRLPPKGPHYRDPCRAAFLFLVDGDLALQAPDYRRIVPKENIPGGDDPTDHKERPTSTPSAGANNTDEIISRKM